MRKIKDVEEEEEEKKNNYLRSFFTLARKRGVLRERTFASKDALTLNAF